MRGCKTWSTSVTDPWWVLNPIVEMHEEGDDENESEEESEESSEEGEEDDDTEEESEDEDEDGKKDTAGLKKALADERKARKAADKKIKAFERDKKKKEDGDKDEVATATSERDKAVATNASLSKLLVKQAVDTAIMQAASKERFRDVSDALSLIKREDIEVDFDIDDFDPETDDELTIEVDMASVTTAVKKLAGKKPHLILADGDEEESGGSVGSKKKKKRGNDNLTEEAVKSRYSVLGS